MIFWVNNIQTAADDCRTHFLARAKLSQAIADDVMENRFLFRDHWEMERTHEPVAFGETIDWGHIPAGDVEWLYAMNRHTSFVNLGKAYRYTGDEKYAEKYAALIMDWMEREPLTEQTRRGTWRSLEAGLRCESWLRCLRLFEGSRALTPALRDKIHACLMAHGEYLVQASGEFQRLSNWGVLQDHGLFLLGVYFGREDWESLAVKRLEEELRFQVFDDGSHWEQSPMYHCEVLHCAIDTVTVARQTGRTLPEGLAERVHRMCTALAKWLTPDGRLICQSDSDDTDARDIVAQGALLFSDGYLRWVAGESLFEENIWDFGSEARALYAAIPPVQPELPSTVLPDSGNYMLRGGFDPDAVYLHMHCGCVGSGHGHADLLHIDLTAFGEDILIDSGRHTYVDSPIRKQLKLPGAHNTTRVDGADFSEYEESWAYSCLAQERKGEYKLTETADVISGGHLGYFNLPGGVVVVSRYVVHLKPNLFVVFDHFIAQGTHRYEQIFHLGRGNAALEGTVLRWEGKRAALTLCSLANDASRTLTREPFSKDYNSLEQGDVLRMECIGDGNTTLAAVLAVEPANQPQGLQAGFVPVTTGAQKLEVHPDTAQAVSIRYGGKAYTVVLCYGDTVPQVGLLHVDGHDGYGRVIVFSPEEPDGRTLLW